MILTLLPEIRSVIEALHASPILTVAATTGCCGGFAGLLMAVPGASKTLLSAHVPYHQSALEAFVRPAPRPHSFVSIAAAEAMATSAFAEARRLAPPGSHVCGIACTGSIKTAQAHRGNHRFIVALASGSPASPTMETRSLVLEKGRERNEEDAIASSVMLGALCSFAGIPCPPVTPALHSSEQIVIRNWSETLIMRPEGWQRTVLPDGTIAPLVVVTGSFNPAHRGHRRMAQVAAYHVSKQCKGPPPIHGMDVQDGCGFSAPGVDVLFEIAFSNPDKKTDCADRLVRSRTPQFERVGAPVCVTSTGIFHDKARVFPGAYFVVGYDTARRVVDPKYYGGTLDGVKESLSTIRSYGCKFIVLGRVGDPAKGDPSDGFLTIGDMSIPEGFEDLFDQVSPECFRCVKKDEHSPFVAHM